MESIATSSSDGVTLAVHRRDGPGQTLLFAHATGFPVLAYRSLLGALPRRFLLVAPDLRGTGGSSWPQSGGADWRGLADDLAAALATTGTRAAGALGVGHSSGATALLLLEARRPGTFSALWCYEPAYFPVGQSGRLAPAATEILDRRVSGAKRRRARFASRDAARGRLAGPLGLSGEALEAYLDHAFTPTGDGTLELVLRPEQEAALYAAAPAAAAVLDATAVTCPVHLVMGAASEHASRSGAEALAERLDEVSTEEIPRAAHLGPLTHASIVADVLGHWLDESPDENRRRATPGA